MLMEDRLRGSLLRCLTLTGLPADQVADCFTTLASPSGARISQYSDFWKPRGLSAYKETTLMETDKFLSQENRNALIDWWLIKVRGARLPNWDIASTCTIGGKRGLLFVEAKAHNKELPEAGKSAPTSSNGKLNHEQISRAIAEANAGLSVVIEGWKLSYDLHYQLCNRFAWSWKIASLGVPVVLVYLGFLKAEEMRDQGQPFDSALAWENSLRTHAKGIVPDEAWGNMFDINGTPAWFLIKSLDYH